MKLSEGQASAFVFLVVYCGAVLILIYRARTVSYTHLDVYKRQVRGFIEWLTTFSFYRRDECRFFPAYVRSCALPNLYIETEFGAQDILA